MDKKLSMLDKIKESAGMTETVKKEVVVTEKVSEGKSLVFNKKTKRWEPKKKRKIIDIEEDFEEKIFAHYLKEGLKLNFSKFVDEAIREKCKRDGII